MASTGLDEIYNSVHEQVTANLVGCDALCVGMDGWQNEKKHALKVCTIIGKKITLPVHEYVFFFYVFFV